LARTFAALRDYAEVIAATGAQSVRMVATSATRDATNSSTFVNGCADILGVAPDVISGDEEAALSFRGATAELPASTYTVVDIGGGSTEFVLGDSDVRRAQSVDVGCVRLTERCLHHDPPTSGEVDEARRVVDAAITGPAAWAREGTLVGVAGSVTTVAALSLGLEAYDADRIHLATLAAAEVSRISAMLLSMTVAERSALPVMHPGRADVIAAGALVLARVVEAMGADAVIASERDILDGIAWSVVR
jgi:exopolyphosphatase/guanosine-5'-triphosphate,3'-diphosphate pyrophosphatase